MSIPKFRFGQTVGIKGGEFTGIIRKCVIDENGITYWIEHAPDSNYCQWDEDYLQEVHIIWEVEAPKAAEPEVPIFIGKFNDLNKEITKPVRPPVRLPKEVEDDEIPF